jgi:hypothetical protein
MAAPGRRLFALIERRAVLMSIRAISCRLTQPVVSATVVALALTASPVLMAGGTVSGNDYEGKSTDGGSFAFITDPNRPLWPGKIVSWYYNPVDQPADVNTTQIVTLIQQAARKWENVCNVSFNYLGTTTARPNLDATFATIDRLSVVGWGPLTGTRAQFSGYTSWWYQNNSSGGPTLVDADMVINTAGTFRFSAATLDSLNGLLTHELGHMLAIDHSDNPQSVMFANPYNTFQFQNTLRGDDAAACVALYGVSPNANANRVFNWAEQTYPSLFAPVGVSSIDGFGYQYRYYPKTNSYVGVQSNTIYYLSSGGNILSVGSVTQYLSQAVSAGF